MERAACTCGLGHSWCSDLIGFSPFLYTGDNTLSLCRGVMCGGARRGGARVSWASIVRGPCWVVQRRFESSVSSGCSWKRAGEQGHVSHTKKEE